MPQLDSSGGEELTLLAAFIGLYLARVLEPPVAILVAEFLANVSGTIITTITQNGAINTLKDNANK